MNRIISFALVIASTMFSFSSVLASETFLNHVDQVSKAMSALYIRELSGGSDRYQRDFLRYKQTSRMLLEQYIAEGGNEGAPLLYKWKNFSEGLNATYSDEYGLEMDPGVRRNFRDYLFQVYNILENNKALYISKKSKLLLAGAKMEVVVARFFDVSSTYDGSNAMFTGDSVNLASEDLKNMNIEKISEEFKEILVELGNDSTDKHINKNLRSAIFAWKLVENNVVNFSDKSAYLVVYAIKNKINKALDLSRDLISIN